MAITKHTTFQTLAGLVLFTCIAISPNQPPTYSLSYTEQEWRAKMQTLTTVQEIMRKSSYPGATIAQWQDSVSAIQADIQKQIGAQIARDTTKTKKP